MMERTCSVDGCERPTRKKGMCGSHYVIQRRLEAPNCSFIGCGVPQSYRALRLCSGHYAQLKKGQRLAPIDREPRPDTCTVHGCARPHRTGGYCDAHYQRHKLGYVIDGPIREHRPNGSTAFRDERGRKECGMCRQWLDPSAFPRGNGLDGLSTKCRACNRRYTLEAHGLTPEQYAALLAAQGGRCPGCGRTAESMTAPRSWHVDHDHACCPGPSSCGKCVRGVMCFNCNVAIGNTKDDPAVLRRLADYLEGARS